MSSIERLGLKSLIFKSKFKNKQKSIVPFFNHRIDDKLDNFIQDFKE